MTTSEKLDTFASQLDEEVKTDVDVELDQPFARARLRVLVERRNSKKLKTQDVSYNGQVIPASTSVKFLGITFDSALTFKSHYHTLANVARHRLLKMNSIFTSTYGPSTSTLLRLYKPYIRSLFDYGAPATCVASPHIQCI